jgi:cytochrome c oxidase subunit II
VPSYLDIPFLPESASSIANDVDLLLTVINLITVVATAGIFLAIIFFAVKYRRGARVNRVNPPQYNALVEVVWTGLPLLILMGIFFWSTFLYLHMRRIPTNAMNVYVVGKQWMWKLQQPQGRWEMNELHVPVNRNIHLNLTSEDVIHSFYVPAFRVKQDANPGQYTHLWFKANRVGKFPLFCAEYCGTNHSTMTGWVYVMEQADYDRWAATGGTNQETIAAAGQRLFHQHQCSGCHGPASSVKAPMLEGIYGRNIPVQIPPRGLAGNALTAALPEIRATTLQADDRYIHDSIVLPEQEIAAGYSNIMPSFKNRISEEEILQIVAYIRSLGNVRQSGANQDTARKARLAGPEEYEARLGFVPPNVKGTAAATAKNPASAAGYNNGTAARDLEGNANLRTGRMR